MNKEEDVIFKEETKIGDCGLKFNVNFSLN